MLWQLSPASCCCCCRANNIKERERESENLILWIFWKVFLPCTRFSEGEGFHWSNIPQSSSSGRLCTKLNNKACQFCCHIRLLQTWYCSYIYISKQTIVFSYWYILKIYYYTSSSALHYKNMTTLKLSHHKDEYDNNEEWNFFVT
jgi:hypothetical protein